MGGGGFTAGRDDPALDDLVLDLTERPRPRLCLLPTAGGDSEHQIRRFYETFGDRLCEPSHISLFRRGQDPKPLEERLLGQDAIYVGGGSMVNLLAIWRAQGLDGSCAKRGCRALCSPASARGRCAGSSGGSRPPPARPRPRRVSASCPARTPFTTTASRPAARSISRPSARARCRPAGRSTTERA